MSDQEYEAFCVYWKQEQEAHWGQSGRDLAWETWEACCALKTEPTVKTEDQEGNDQ